jgi:hypothetical protein
LLGLARPNGLKPLNSFFVAQRTKEGVDETAVACVSWPVGYREFFRRSTASPPASPALSFSRALHCSHLELLPETGEESVRTAAEAELLEERYLEKAVHAVV